MMLFTKDIDKKLFQQYDMGSNLEKQKVIAKIFNPYGNGRWFLINSDPNDSDYIWAIVQMGDTVEVGSVSRQDLISARVGRFRFPLERDLGFSPVNAAELFRGLNQGKFYADGGETEVEEEQTVTRGFYEDEPYEYAKGGDVKWQDARIGDSARVKSENKMGIIKKDYGRKFHLKFVDGTEKTYDASELEFIKDEDEYAKGGEITPYIVWVSKDGEKREFYGEYKSMRAANMKMDKLWESGEYKRIGNKPKSMYEKEGFYADGGYMAKGGGVEDKFKGKNSKEVWNNLDSSTRAKVLEYLFLKEKSGDNQYYDSYNSLNELSYNEWDKLPKNIKKEIENFDKGDYMAKGGGVDGGKLRNGKYKYEKGDEGMFQGDEVRVVKYNTGYGGTYEYNIIDEDGKVKTHGVAKAEKFENQFAYFPKMNMGGKVTFDDKVSSIKKSLLKKKTVSPKVQKDYGKTYNKKEALESAQRIAGAMRAKYKK
jgi:hypothetical protein